jgi:excisionase family DNA binding protein
LISRSHTVKEVAEHLGVSDRTIRNWIVSGLLPATNIGSPARPHYRVAESDLDRFLAERTVKP